MYLVVKELYPNEEVYEDYLHPQLRFSAGRRMELDVFVPSRSLAFEYQVCASCIPCSCPEGVQHYDTNSFFGKADIRIERDNEKKNACLKHNIRLIYVPYWLKIDKQNIQDLLNKSNLEE